MNYSKAGPPALDLAEDSALPLDSGRVVDLLVPGEELDTVSSLETWPPRRLNRNS